MSKTMDHQHGKLEERVGSRSLYIEMRARKDSIMPNFHYHTSYLFNSLY